MALLEAPAVVNYLVRGPEIRAVRESAKLSRSAVAEHAGMSLGRVMSIELERRRWTPEEMRHLARAIWDLSNKRHMDVEGELKRWFVDWGMTL